MGIKILIEGFIYAVILGAIVTVSQLFNARLWLNCYPKAIQEVVPQRTKKEIKIKLLIGIPFMLVMLGYPAYSTLVLKNTVGIGYNFWIGFINLIVIQNAFNLFDLFILDWLIFCTIKPKYLELEGTHGMKEYGDYVFHLKAAFKGFILSVIYSGIVAALTVVRGLTY